MSAPQLARERSRAPYSPVNGGTRRRGGVMSSRSAMCFDPLMPLDTWKELGATIGKYANASNWWLGDWLAFGKVKYGRRYKEGVVLTGLDYQTLRNYASVARRFEPSRRRDTLSFQHHADLCALPNHEQERWLDAAEEHRWSRADLRRRLRAGRRSRAAAARDVQLGLVLTAPREQRWRAAASRSDCALLPWIMQVVDDAATTALDRARA